MTACSRGATVFKKMFDEGLIYRERLDLTGAPAVSPRSATSRSTTKSNGQPLVRPLSGRRRHRLGRNPTRAGESLSWRRPGQRRSSAIRASL